MPAAAPGGRQVKSVPAGAAEAVDGPERAKDNLAPAEVTRLLDVAKAGRHDVRDHLLVSMTHRHGLEGQRGRRPAPGRARPRPALGALPQGRALGRAADRRQRAARHPTLPSHPRRHAAVAFRLGARSGADRPSGELPRRRRLGARRPPGRPSVHAAPFPRLCARRQGPRPAAHPGGLWLPRPPAHRPPYRRPAHREALAVSTTPTSGIRLATKRISYSTRKIAHSTA